MIDDEDRHRGRQVADPDRPKLALGSAGRPEVALAVSPKYQTDEKELQRATKPNQPSWSSRLHDGKRGQLGRKDHNAKPHQHGSPIVKFHVVLTAVERSAQPIEHVEAAGGDRL